jgi:hypothetical protein
MPDTTTICETCQFENHATCQFCIRCGNPLAAAARSPATTTVLAELAEETPDTRPRPDVAESIGNLIQQLKLPSRETPAGFLVDVPLDGERTQKVSILLNEKDRDGEQAVTLVSVCGPATEKHALQLLQVNAQLKYCAFAVRKVQGEKMFVVTGSQYGATADAAELEKLLLTVAKTADRLEEKLTQGSDEF